MNLPMSRRAMIAGAAALPAAAAFPATSMAAERTPPNGFHRVLDDDGRVWFKADGEDPMFAAIDAYKKANAFHTANLTRADEIESKLWEIAEERARPKMKSRNDFKAKNPDFKFNSSDEEFFSTLTRQELRELKSTSEAIEVERLREEGSAAEVPALWKMISTVPTTAAGALALFEFLEDQRQRGGDVSGMYNEEDREVYQVIAGNLCAFIRARMAVA